MTVDGATDPDHRALGHVSRIEQAGNRLIVTGGGVVHDMRCDGTLDNGVHDVAEFDKVTAIHVVATYEDGVHVLRPQGMPIEVRRWRDGDHLLWQYVGFTARMRVPRGVRGGSRRGDGLDRGMTRPVAAFRPGAGAQRT